VAQPETRKPSTSISRKTGCRKYQKFAKNIFKKSAKNIKKIQKYQKLN